MLQTDAGSGVGDDNGSDDGGHCLGSAADRLRAVRQAHERFLALWALDSLLASPAAAARAWADLGDGDGDGDGDGTEHGPDSHARAGRPDFGRPPSSPRGRLVD